MFETFKLNRELKKERLKKDIAETKLSEQSIQNAFKQIENLESSRLVRDDLDSELWIQTGVGSDSINNNLYDHYQMLDMAYRFWSTNLHARAIVRNLCKFVLGRGPTVKPKSDNKKVNESWKRFKKVNKWSLKEKEIVSRVFRDGELFIRFYPSKKKDGSIPIRFIRAQKIRNPMNEKDWNKNENVSFGIGTDKKDVEKVLTYYLCDFDGKLIEKISAEQILHIKILVDSDVKRGMSFLLIAMKMLRKYGDWLDDRIALNKVRSAIALVRTVEGTSNTVESIRDAQKSRTEDKSRNKLKAYPSATVLTASKGVKYEMLSPNIQASDVKDDGRAMLLCIAAGTGMPEMMLTANYANGNYSSSMVAQNPFVREIEDWQDFFQYFYQVIFGKVVEHDIKYGVLTEGTDDECTVEFPPLILADTLKNNQAREIQHRNKVLSKKTWALKEGLDPEEEERNQEEEQTKDIYKTPFNLPTHPTNQWGSYSDEDDIDIDDEDIKEIDEDN